MNDQTEFVQWCQATRRVREYLDYRARLRDVPGSRRRVALARVLDACRLRDVETRVIGQLSHGYRQRVGLADALIHDPDILILDEPTSGLDPIQIREVRSLILDLGQRHTILLSAHIMQEVEAVCSRVILIAGGRVVLDDALDRLRSEVAVVIEATGPADALRRALEAAPEVARVLAKGEEDGVHRFEVRVRPGGDPREGLAKRVLQSRGGLRRLDWQRSSLEDRFVAAVARATSGEGGAA